jgi:hypothetical protein
MKTKINLDIHKFFILFNNKINDKDEDKKLTSIDKNMMKIFIKNVKEKITKNDNLEIINELEKYKDFDEDEIITIKLHSYESYIEDNELCMKKDKKTGVDKKFTKNSIENSNAIIVLQETNDDNSNIIGFATLFFDIDDNSIYVDVLCSSDKFYKGGSEILNKIKELGKIINYDAIKLDSIKDAVDFYRRNNFTFDCDENCKMKYKIKGGLMSCKNKKKRKSKNNTTKKSKIKSLN